MTLESQRTANNLLRRLLLEYGIGDQTSKEGCYAHLAHDLKGSCVASVKTANVVCVSSFRGSALR